MKLRYTPAALAELEDVLGYIAERSPRGAGRVQARIQEVLELLLRHPLSGQRTNIDRVRRFAAVPYPYLIYYEQTASEIIIIGIRHARRDPGSMPDSGRS